MAENETQVLTNLILEHYSNNPKFSVTTQIATVVNVTLKYEHNICPDGLSKVAEFDQIAIPLGVVLPEFECSLYFQVLSEQLGTKFI